MNIEEAIEILNELKEIFSSPDPFKDDKDYDRAVAIETLLTAYEKEKEINKQLENCLQMAKQIMTANISEDFGFMKLKEFENYLLNEIKQNENFEE